VHERESEPGGHLRELAWLPTRGSWRHAVEDLVAAVERGGSDLVVASAPGVHALAAASADVIVVATGSTWDEEGVSPRRPERTRIPGIETGAVLGLGAALARARDDPRSLGARVVIADDVGTYAPLGLAEALAAAGVEVHLVTPNGAIGAEAAAELELPHLMPRLRRMGVTLTTWHDIDSVDGRRVVLGDVWGGGRRALQDVDSVVLALQRSPRDDLFVSLRSTGVDLRLVGDARSPRSTAAVIHEAEALARAL
jgi:hypothetical protein